MVLGLALALALQEVGKPDTVGEALRFLVRHQRADGSWGERPEKCTCPVERKADAERVAALLRDFDADDPIAREAAREELRNLDGEALPHLRAAAKHPDPEIAKFCAALARRLELATPGAGDVELTALALLAFFGAGYSPLSGDVGPVVKCGLRWLGQHRNEEGDFDAKDPVANAVAALAVSEEFATTNCENLRDGAQKAVDRVAARPMESSRGLVWKGMVLKSAELASLEVSPGAVRKNFEALAARRDATAEAGYPMISLFVNKTWADARLSNVTRLDPAALETEALYFADLAMFQFAGPKGDPWTAWYAKVKERVLPGQRTEKTLCRRGSWDGLGYRGRLRATALQGMMFEIYYITGVDR